MTIFELKIDTSTKHIYVSLAEISAFTVKVKKQYIIENITQHLSEEELIICKDKGTMYLKMDDLEQQTFSNDVVLITDGKIVEVMNSTTNYSSMHNKNMKYRKIEKATYAVAFFIDGAIIYHIFF